MTNRSLFDLNGGCGYVLKPSPGGVPTHGLRIRLRVLSAHNLPKAREERCEPNPWDRYHPELSATFAEPPLSSDVVTPQLEIEAFGGRITPVGGAPDEGTDLLRWEQTPQGDNGLCTGWPEDEAPEFACDVWRPHASFLRVSVYSARGTGLLGRTTSRQLLATEIVPVQAIRHGYRSLALRSPNGCHVEACRLLLKVKLERVPRAQRPSPRTQLRHAHRGQQPAQRPKPAGAMAWSNMRLSTIGARALRSTIVPGAGRGD